MNRNCSFNLTDDAHVFAVECFELILEVEGQEKYYVYRKGLTDGVNILKYLGALV